MCTNGASGSRVVALVRVRAEEVALGLGQVLGEVGGAVAVVVGEGRGEGGGGDAVGLGAADAAAPGFVRARDLAGKESSSSRLGRSARRS